MGLYSLLHDGYKFIINTVDKKVFVYENDCCPEDFGALPQLPEGISWGDIDIIFSDPERPAFLRKVIIDKNTLAEKLYEVFESSLKSKV